MTAAHRLPDLTASPLRAQRGGLATTPTMDIHTCSKRFWQLDAEQRFSGNETRLYFYWVNRFNAEFWPSEMARTCRQVEADLVFTDKTHSQCRAVLMARGLLFYEEGDKRTKARWSLVGKLPTNLKKARNNSDESAPIAPQMPRSFSDENDGVTPQMPRKNSDPYIEQTKTVLEQETQTKKNAGAGDAFSSPSPSPKITAPTPVAAPPAPPSDADDAEPVLPPDDPAEARAFVPELAKRWHISQQLNAQGWRKLTAFALAVAAQGKLAYLRQQFAGFNAFFSDGLTPHNLDKFCGHEGQSPPYSLGTWCSEGDWQAKAKDRRRPAGSTPPEAPARASFSRSKSKENR
jgi:hypothetical protein